MGRLLDRLDRWFERRYQIRPIGAGGHVLGMAVVRYRGPRVELRDGTVVRPGDPVGELHMDNRRVGALHGGGAGGFRFRREIFRLLPALARDLRTRPEYGAIDAVCGASLFWAEATHAGFEHRPLPAFTRWWLGWWERVLLVRHHPEGRRRLDGGRRMEVRRVWITRRTLLRFDAQAGRTGEARDGSPDRRWRRAPHAPDAAPEAERAAAPSDRRRS